MPEIKHNFSQGKMNKDLDERLVPNGQYRHALNIRVSTSEGSDVGAVTNILGNTIITTKDLFLNNAFCIGAISDEKNDCFYWFVKNDTNSPDYILKYSQKDGIQPVVVDSSSSTLNFQNKTITGINIIEDLLFWTDNHNEPKKINIENCMLGTPDFSTNTVVHNPLVDNIVSGYSDSNVQMEEEHVTVIKRAPLRQPFLDLFSDGLFNPPGVIKRFRFADSGGTLWQPGNYPGSTSTSSTGSTDINFKIFNSSTSKDYNITPGVTIIQLKSVAVNQIGYDTDSDGLIDELNENFNQEYSYNSDYDIRLKITSIDPGQSSVPTGTQLSGFIDVHAEIISIKPNTTINFSAWVVNFEQASDTLFENKFPRFAYRYKYLDGEYSPFSPFTKIAFNPSTYSQDTVKGYNVGMRNDLREVVLSGFVSKDYEVSSKVFSKEIPHDVVGVDLLYKESNSPIVYVVDSITPEDTAWDVTPNNATASLYGNGEYSITSDTIYKVTASNQLLRGFDSVPKKALAQEIIGNRIVYGNYMQNMNINKEVDLSFEYDTSNTYFIFDEIGVPSVKTLRSYQLGVVYEDKYGRQTPVLTNKDAVLNLPITESKKPNVFKATINSNAPADASSFKYFIKETSSEYYNLPLARWYNAADDNIWLSFISADRNKIDEEDYLYLKKAHGSDKAVETPTKYKVLAIANEAPDYIKVNRQSLGKLSHNSADSELLFNDYTFMPIKSKSVFRVNTNIIESSGYAKIEELDKLEMILSDPSNNDFSDRYEITSAVKDQLNPSGYIITIQGVFGTDVNFIEDTTSTASIPVIKDGVVLEITGGKIENKPEFDGKFFVKINKDFSITNHILPFTGNADDMSITHQEPLLMYDTADDDLPSITGGNQWTGQVTVNANANTGRNGAYSLVDARNDAKPYFGDGTTSNTLASNGPKWFIDAMPHEGQTEYEPDGTLITLLSNPLHSGNNPGNPQHGVNDGISGNQISISYSGIKIPDDGTGNSNLNGVLNGLGWAVGEISNIETDHEVTMVRNLAVGKQFYFADDPDKTMYTILGVTSYEYYNYINFGDGSASPSYNHHCNRRKTWKLTLDKHISSQTYDPRTALNTSASPVSATNSVSINFVEYLDQRDKSPVLTKNPAVFETKPKKDEGLEIYHEASHSYDITTHGDTFSLDWCNCISFGNGVESDRIQDDFNAVTIDNGPKVSAEFEGEYKEETILNRLIFSGIYNSKNSVNRTNEFIAAEGITKDINPTYGSIQKLYTRNSDLVTFCEDKVLRILANKDALFNADGNTNLTASSNVLGQAIPFAGSYGISKNPESFSYEKYRAYFTDKQRGAVLRLSMDGITPISEYGMSNYFRDNLKNATKILGSYDAYNKEYNVTISSGDKKETVSYKERVNGWSSFKSYTPEFALSSSNTYYSFDQGTLYEHDSNEKHNNFYNTQYTSNITVLLNDVSGSIKDYKTLNYEGSQARVIQETTNKKSGYYNLQEIRGWSSESIVTDKDKGVVNEFIEKEGKWFNYIKGE